MYISGSTEMLYIYIGQNNFILIFRFYQGEVPTSTYFLQIHIEDIVFRNSFVNLTE